MSISNVKLPFYPPYEVKCELQNKRKTKIKLELLPPNKSSLSWFWPFSLVNLVTTKPKLVSKPLKLEDQDQKMFLSEKYWLESVLWKNSLFDSFFSSESCAFYQRNSSSLKIYHFRLYIVENRGLGAAPKWCGICSKPSFNVENLSFLVYETLTCTCMPLYAYACIKQVHVDFEHMCAYTHIRTHVLGFLRPYFSKNRFI